MEPKRRVVRTVEEGRAFAAEVGFPEQLVVVKVSMLVPAEGGAKAVSVVSTVSELEEILSQALESEIFEVSVEQVLTFPAP